MKNCKLSDKIGPFKTKAAAYVHAAITVFPALKKRPRQYAQVLPIKNKKRFEIRVWTRKRTA